MGRLIYLAGPLDGLDIDGTTWYDEWVKVAPDDVVSFMPGRAYLGAVDAPSEMDRANRAIIAASVGVVANLSGPGRALGTIREIEFAKSLRKPVLVVGDLSASLASHDLQMFDSLQAVSDHMASRKYDTLA
jgi:hypothetical protein